MFSSKDIGHLAALARLKLADGEIGRYQRELDDILEYVSKLQEIENGKSPIANRQSPPEFARGKQMAGRNHGLELREDEPTRPFADDPGASSAALIEQMGEVKDGFLKVPKVIKKPRAPAS